MLVSHSTSSEQRAVMAAESANWPVDDILLEKKRNIERIFGWSFQNLRLLDVALVSPHHGILHPVTKKWINKGPHFEANRRLARVWPILLESCIQIKQRNKHDEDWEFSQRVLIQLKKREALLQIASQQGFLKCITPSQRQWRRPEPEQIVGAMHATLAAIYLDSDMKIEAILTILVKLHGYLDAEQTTLNSFIDLEAEGETQPSPNAGLLPEPGTLEYTRRLRPERFSPEAYARLDAVMTDEEFAVIRTNITLGPDWQAFLNPTLGNFDSYTDLESSTFDSTNFSPPAFLPADLGNFGDRDFLMPTDISFSGDTEMSDATVISSKETLQTPSNSATTQNEPQSSIDEGTVNESSPHNPNAQRQTKHQKMKIATQSIQSYVLGERNKAFSTESLSGLSILQTRLARVEQIAHLRNPDRINKLFLGPTSSFSVVCVRRALLEIQESGLVALYMSNLPDALRIEYYYQEMLKLDGASAATIIRSRIIMLEFYRACEGDEGKKYARDNFRTHEFRTKSGPGSPEVEKKATYKKIFLEKIPKIYHKKCEEWRRFGQRLDKLADKFGFGILCLLPFPSEVLEHPLSLRKDGLGCGERGLIDNAFKELFQLLLQNKEIVEKFAKAATPIYEMIINGVMENPYFQNSQLALTGEETILGIPHGADELVGLLESATTMPMAMPIDSSSFPASAALPTSSEIIMDLESMIWNE